MKSTRTPISDAAILNLICANDLRGWEQLYDKYAPVMYGVICVHISDKGVAEEILIKLFTNLKHERILFNVDFALSVCILRYTYCNTWKELKRRGIAYSESPVMSNSMLDIFCTQYITIAQVAAKLNISKKEVKQNLHIETLILRSKYRYTQPTQQQETHKDPALLYQ